MGGEYPAARHGEEPQAARERPLEDILRELLDDAAARGLIHDDVTSRDLFDTELMGHLTPRPGQVIRTFCDRYEKDPRAATDWFYDLCQNADYIRRYRIARDVKWKVATGYGELDITINLSKPEKDPKAIAAAKAAPQRGYPKCLLCRENEGYAGRIDHPARQNLRIIPVTINEEDWFFQYSPYVYYNEHCIVFNGKHTPMKIERATFRKLLDFVALFPHYFVGSNADLPIVGGSILSHDHFQGGHYEFAMAKAPIEIKTAVTGSASTGSYFDPASMEALKDAVVTRAAVHFGDVTYKDGNYVITIPEGEKIQGKYLTNILPSKTVSKIQQGGYNTVNGENGVIKIENRDYSALTATLKVITKCGWDYTTTPEAALQAVGASKGLASVIEKCITNAEGSKNGYYTVEKELKTAISGNNQLVFGSRSKTQTKTYTFPVFVNGAKKQVVVQLNCYTGYTEEYSNTPINKHSGGTTGK